MSEGFTWRPNAGPQSDFLASSAYEVLYGGAAGGGKSESLLVAPLRWISSPSFSALLMRRTYPELERSLINRSRELYPHVDRGAKYREQTKTWTFSTGARIAFGHCEHDTDVHQYQGAEFSFIGFDEGTHFTEAQYTYMQSRARSASGLPVRIRIGTNPGGDGADWVMKRFAPWLDPNAPRRAKPGEVLYYVNMPDGETRYLAGAEEAFALKARWASAGSEERLTLPIPLSRQFIPARVSDNPHLMNADPGYIDRLRGLDAVNRERLLNGNWLARPAAGLYFRREWFKLIDVAPAHAAIRVRRWDLASTEDGGDWTVGVRMASTGDGTCVVEDVVRLRGRPSAVEAAVLNTARIDPKGTKVWLPQDPGQAGKAQCEAYAHLLQGFAFSFERETGDKVTRAEPFSAQCEARNIALVRAPWNEAFLQCLEGFPEGAHDDDVDAASGAYAQIVAFLPSVTYLAGIKQMAKEAQGRR